MSKNTKIICSMFAAIVIIVIMPFFLARGAEFEGSDNAGSEMVEEISGGTYEPWFTPVMETAIGGELSGELESLLFCLQTGIGVGVSAFSFGYLVARKRYSQEDK